MKAFAVSKVFQPAQVFYHGDPFIVILTENLEEAAEKLGGRRLAPDEVCKHLGFSGEKWRMPDLFKEDYCAVLASEKENGELLFFQELPIFLWTGMAKANLSQ